MPREAKAKREKIKIFENEMDIENEVPLSEEE